MTQPVIPDEIQRFILLSIPSVPFLEALLLLRGAPDRAWQARQVGERLYLAEQAAAALLADLCQAGLAAAASEPGQVCYCPQSGELAAMIDRLASVYAHNLIGVSTLIHSKTGKKAMQFANAFVIRKDS